MPSCTTCLFAWCTLLLLCTLGPIGSMPQPLPLTSLFVGSLSSAMGTSARNAAGNGFYYWVFDSKLFCLNPSNSFATSTYNLPSSEEPSNLVWDEDSSLLFVCVPSAVLLFDPNNPSLGVQPIWQPDTEDFSVESCESPVSGVLWVAISNISHVALRPLYEPGENVFHPWLVSSNKDFVWQRSLFGAGRPIALYSQGDGTMSIAISSYLTTFPAVPEPPFISMSHPQRTSFPLAFRTSRSDTLAIFSNPMAWERTSTGSVLHSVIAGDHNFPFSSPTYDPVSNAMWIGIGDVDCTRKIRRFSLDPNSATNPTHQLSMPAVVPCPNGRITQGAVDPISQTAMVWVLPWQFVIVPLYTCSAATSCSSCAQNGPYCAWCGNANGTSSCVPTATCTAPSFAASVCPVASVTSPTSISKEGMTDIIVYGSNFQSLQEQIGTFYCSLDTSFTPATVYSDSMIKCLINQTESTGTLNLKLNFANGAPIVTLLSLPAYSCDSESSCTDCTAENRPDCKWCISDALCKSRLATNTTCPTPGSLQVSLHNPATSCTLLHALTPNSTPTHFKSDSTLPQLLTLTLTNPVPTGLGGWTCVFGFGLNSTTGFYDGISGGILCPIPELSIATAEETVAVQLKLGTRLFAPNTLPLRFYRCDLSSNCTSCQGACSFCLTDGKCVASNAGTCSQSATGTCPSAALSPLSTLGEAATSLTITGGPFIASTSYECQFGTPILETAPATFINSSALQCVAPARSSDPYFDALVTIIVAGSGNIIASAGPLRYYDCSAAQESCITCAHPLHTACAWCMESSSCGNTATMGACTSLIGPGTCPTIFGISPTSGAYQGGITIEVTGTGFSYAGSYKCTFSGPTNSTSPVTKLSVDATISNDTHASCIAPAISPASRVGPYDFGMDFIDASDITTPLNSLVRFDFLNCMGIRNCSQCLRTSQCAWCKADSMCKQISESCRADIRVTNDNECPVLTSVAPLQVAAVASSSVSVKGKNLYDESTFWALRCTLDGLNPVTPTDFSASGGVDSFICPSSNFPSLGTNDFLLAMMQSPTRPYATTANGVPFSITTYNCSASQTCNQCAALTGSPCGWCAADNACSEVSMCSKVQTWSASSCPRIIKLSTTQIDESFMGSNLVVHVSNLGMANTLPLACAYLTPGMSRYAPVVSFSLADGTVACPLEPLSDFVGVVSVQLVTGADYSNYFTSNLQDRYFDPDSKLEVISCSPPGDEIGTCGTCINAIGSDIDPRCGWCVYGGYCGVPSGCQSGTPLASFQLSPSECATVTGIDPTSGPSTGDTLITVTGTNFVQSNRLHCQFGNDRKPATFVSTTQVTCLSPSTSIQSGSASSQFSLVMFKPSRLHKRDDPGDSLLQDSTDKDSGDDDNTILTRTSRQRGARRDILAVPDEWVLFATSIQPIAFTFNYVPPTKKTNLAWIAAPIILVLVVLVVAVVVAIYWRGRYAQRALTPPDFAKYAFSANSKLLRDVPDEHKPQLDELVPFLNMNHFALSLALTRVARGSDDDLIARALVYVAQSHHFTVDMLLCFITEEVKHSKMEGELFRASSIACKMYTVYSKVIGVQYLWRTLARSIHALNDAGAAEDDRQASGGSSSSSHMSSGHVSMIDLGSLEVDPERLAEKLERNVDEAVMTDVAIYQYELLSKTTRIFKRVMDSVDSVPEALRTIARQVRDLVATKYPQHEMDYKGVCAFFFLRFICPAVMTPQIYGVLESPPGETAQRYFVLISKTLQCLANGTLPSNKEAYMAKMDEFVLDNKETLHKFIDELCKTTSIVASSQGDYPIPHGDTALEVSSELRYSSLSFIHTLYMANADKIQADLKANGEEELAIQVNEVMTSITPDKKIKKKTKKSATSSNV